MPYLVLFGILIFLAVIAVRIKKIRELLVVLIIVIMSVFGGLRTKDVGTDLGVYGVNYYTRAENSDTFKGYLKLRDKNENSIQDLGYLSVNFASAKLFGNFNVFLILLQLLTNAPVIWVISKKSKKDFPIALLVYLCIFYGRSLNLLRQSIALSFLYFAHYQFDCKKKMNALVSTVISMLFHSTAIYAVTLMGLTKLIANNKTKKKPKSYRMLITLSFVAVICIPFLLGALHSAGIISNRLYSYTSDFAVSSDAIPLADIFINTILILVIMIARVNKKQKESEAPLYSTLGYIFSFTRIFIRYSDRFSLYFQIFNPESIAVSLDSFKGRRRVAVTLLIVLALLTYWYVKHVVQGGYQIIPYRSVL